MFSSTSESVNRGPVLNIVIWIEAGIALIIFLSRVFSRTKLNRCWSWDDIFMCMAMSHAIAHTTLLSIGVYHGTGQHGYHLSEENEVQANKFNWISLGLNVMSTNWGKISVGFFLLRIVPEAKRQKRALYVGMALLTLVNTLSLFSLYRPCRPIQALWDSRIKRECWAPNVQRNYAYFQGAFSALSDFLLAMYPVFMIRRSQAGYKLKIAFAGIVALGILAMVAAISRTIFLTRISIRNDYTFTSFEFNLALSTEQYLIIVAACIPTIEPLATSIADKLSSYSAGSESLSRSTPRHYPYSHSRSRTQSTNMILTGSNSQIYPLSEYKGWVGTESPRDRSVEALTPSEEITSGGILKTMEVQINSSHEAHIAGDISLVRKSQYEV